MSNVTNNFFEAKDVLERGGVIVYPTDTVYGLGCCIFAQNAIKRIFELKRRDNKPLSVAFYNIEQLEKYAELNSKERGFIEEKLKTLDEGYTFVVKKKKNMINDLVTAGKNTIGARIMKYSAAIGLTYAVGPIITTSANISGGQPVIKAEDLDEKIKEGVDLVYVGKCIYGKPSKVISLLDGSVLRE